MRELRGAGIVDVKHIPGTENPADIFTKVLPPQPFHKHRKKIFNCDAYDATVERPSNSGFKSQEHASGKP